MDCSTASARLASTRMSTSRLVRVPSAPASISSCRARAWRGRGLRWFRGCPAAQATRPSERLSTRRQRLAAAEVGVLGLDRVQGDEGGVGDSLGQRHLLARALVEGYADYDAVADDERGGFALLDVCQGRGDADALLRERLAAGEDEARIAADEAGECLGRFGVDVGEQAVGPV